jgi:4-aminobutyrate aminotransferase / (S)-3-amino-2-methylpropionate transaminase / 5-aminovalerate transaminase
VIAPKEDVDGLRPSSRRSGETSPGALTVEPLEQVRRVVTPIPGPRSRAIHARRELAVPAAVSSAFPAYIDRAGGGILVDVDGNQIIDMASGVATTPLGATDSSVVERAQRQLERFTHTAFIVSSYESYVEVAERLNRLTPGAHDKRTALFSTGAEAIENAVKIARAATGRSEVVAFANAFHGRTMLALGLTDKEMPYKRGFGPFPAGIHRNPFPDPLRWPAGPDSAMQDSLRRLDLLLKSLRANVAAIVIEPIQGEGGFIVPPPGFLAELAVVAAKQEIVLIFDEIQSGLGRTGKLFACDHEGVVPDIVCTGKALGGGLPLAAVTGTASVMDAVHPSGIGGTYAGTVRCSSAQLSSVTSSAVPWNL